MMLKRVHRIVLIVIVLGVGEVWLSMNKPEVVKNNPLFDSNDSSVSSSSSEPEAARPGSAVLWKLVDESLAAAEKAGFFEAVRAQGLVLDPQQLALAMASHELFRRLFDAPAGKQFWTAPMSLEMLGLQQEWDQFIERDYPQESWPYMKAKVGTAGATGISPRWWARCMTRRMTGKKDLVVHVVAHTLLTSFQEQKTPPLWIAGRGWPTCSKSSTCSAARRTTASRASRCWKIRPGHGASGQVARDAQDLGPAGQEPQLRQMVQAQLDSMSSAERIKVFSIMEYLLAERRKDLIALLAQLRTDHPHDEAMELLFGFEKLDKDWKAFVLKSY